MGTGRAHRRWAGSWAVGMCLLVGCTTPDKKDEGAAGPSSASPIASAAPSASAAGAATTPDTINAWIARPGSATVVRGTAGDDASDRAIAAQAALIAPIVGAETVDDTSIDAARGAAAWPAKPILYGGPHVNAALARLTLPFELSPGKLVLGGETFTGDEYLLMTVVPGGSTHPDFLLYAGTGTPGIAEINGITHGSEQILIVDTFGRLVAGQWERQGGALVAKLGERARRVPWRTVEEKLSGTGGQSGVVRFQFVEQVPKRDDERAIIDAGMRGFRQVVDKLRIEAPISFSVYVHPDRRSKKSLTGNEGDGHAMIAARALHTIAGPNLESHFAHEGTHLLAYAAWGATASPLLGEGLAVWVSGKYALKPIDDYRAELAKGRRSTILDLLHPKAFRSVPEQASYPLAGLLFDALVTTVGADKVREHLLGATHVTWAEACQRAGTSPEALEKALDDRLER
jgi:hypothetical protein